MVPWAANLATLAVVVATIGWSSEQRPGPASVEAAAVRPSGQAAPVVPVSDQAPAPQSGVSQAHWPVKTSALAADGLKTVGYTPAQLR